MENRFFYSFLGLLMGFSVPLNWLLWRAFSARRAWWISWLRTEFSHQGNIYICLGIVAVSIFGLVGYLLGKNADQKEERSKNLDDHNLTLSQLASTDGLTGLYNVRYIHERLDIELENSFRSTLTCLLVDIDHFKRINDTFGHPFGDLVLVHVAKILRRVVRPLDAVGRLGGEEFIVILPGISADRGFAIAERIRTAIQAEKIVSDEKQVSVTVSLGVASYPSDGIKNKDGLLKAIDLALYSAKRNGRDRAIVWQEKNAA